MANFHSYEYNTLDWYDRGGSFTWTKPDDIDDSKPILVHVWGAGGSGDDHYSFSTTTTAAGGGGGGLAVKLIDVSALGATETVTVGAPELPNARGGLSSFGSHCSASGGNGGCHSSSNEGLSGNGAGGLGVGGDVNKRGGTGGNGYYSTSSNSAGGGGGSAPAPYGVSDGFNGGGGTTYSGGGGEPPARRVNALRQIRERELVRDICNAPTRDSVAQQKKETIAAGAGAQAASAASGAQRASQRLALDWLWLAATPRRNRRKPVAKALPLVILRVLRQRGRGVGPEPGEVLAVPRAEPLPVSSGAPSVVIFLSPGSSAADAAGTFRRKRLGGIQTPHSLRAALVAAARRVPGTNRTRVIEPIHQNLAHVHVSPRE